MLISISLNFKSNFLIISITTCRVIPGKQKLFMGGVLITPSCVTMNTLLLLPSVIRPFRARIAVWNPEDTASSFSNILAIKEVVFISHLIHRKSSTSFADIPCSLSSRVGNELCMVNAITEGVMEVGISCLRTP